MNINVDMHLNGQTHLGCRACVGVGFMVAVSVIQSFSDHNGIARDGDGDGIVLSIAVRLNSPVFGPVSESES